MNNNKIGLKCNALEQHTFQADLFVITDCSDIL